MPYLGVGQRMRNPQQQPAKQNRAFADLVGVAGGAWVTTTYVRDENPYLGPGQRTGEYLQI